MHWTYCPTEKIRPNMHFFQVILCIATQDNQIIFSSHCTECTRAKERKLLRVKQSYTVAASTVSSKILNCFTYSLLLPIHGPNLVRMHVCRREGWNNSAVALLWLWKLPLFEKWHISNLHQLWHSLFFVQVHDLGARKETTLNQSKSGSRHTCSRRCWCFPGKTSQLSH